MKKNSSKCLLLIGLFLSTLTMAQTDEQIDRIKQKTNVTNLNQLATAARAKAEQEKEAAWTLASQNGWQTQFVDAEGNFLELRKISPEGKPLYFKTMSNKASAKSSAYFSNVAAALSTRANWLHNGGGLGLDLDI